MVLHRDAQTLLAKLWNAVATATVVTLVAGFLLFARPATYTATALVVGQDASLPLMQSAARLRRLAAELDEAPQIKRLRPAGPDTPSMAAQLQTRLGARPATRAGWLALAFTHEDPAIAALVANTAARLAVPAQRSDSDAAGLVALEAAEAALQAFVAAHPEVSDADRRQTALTAQDAAREGRLAELDQRIQAQRGQLAAVMANDLDPVEGRQGIVRIRQQLDRALLNQGALARRYGPMHQKMVAAAGEVEAAQRLLAEQVALARGQLDRALLTLVEQRQALVAEAAALDAQRRRLVAGLQEQARLQLALEQARRRYDRADDAADAIAEAVIPLSPDLPSELPWLAVLFAGIGLGSLALQWRRS